MVKLRNLKTKFCFVADEDLAEAAAWLQTCSCAHTGNTVEEGGSYFPGQYLFGGDLGSSKAEVSTRRKQRSQISKKRWRDSWAGKTQKGQEKPKLETEFPLDLWTQGMVIKRHDLLIYMNHLQQCFFNFLWSKPSCKLNFFSLTHCSCQRFELATMLSSLLPLPLNMHEYSKA